MYAQDPRYIDAQLHDAFDLAFVPKLRGGSYDKLPPAPGIFAFRDPVQRQLAFIGWLEGVGGLGAYETIVGLGLSWGAVKRTASRAGRAIKRGASAAYDATIGAAVDFVAEGVNWVCEKVKDLDQFLERQFEKIGLGGVYRKISDYVVKIGKEALVTVGETIDGAINLIIVEGGKYIGALAAGLACGAGNIVGVAIPPTVCATIGAQLGDMAGEAAGKLKEKIKRDYRNASNPKDVPPGVQALQRGIASATCPPPDPKDIICLYDEPVPAASPIQKAQHFEALAQRAGRGKCHDYYACRARSARFEATMANVGISPALTSLSVMKFPLAKSNITTALTNFNMIGTRRLTHSGLKIAPGGVKLSKHAQTTEPKKKTDNTWVWIASGVTVVGLGVILKKKGVI